ncbi:kinase-like domain-containing protein [Gigaspora margarita]|uniref:Kinase-like domain-containing protein n=1 Tax=Gigaspora margarita TaxID=4874 RepID=A0A8H4AI58_GIGMA|nr:kinase-like domain-containing protein [Gigaspora margarita]
MNDLSVINQNRVNEYWKKSWALVNIEKYPTADLQFESVRSSFHGDPSLLEHERIHLINRLEKFKTRWKSSHRNTGADEKRQCQICQSWTYSIQYCEFCIQDYLKVDFGNWTSGNDEIDIIIRQSQICVSSPEKIFRWIPYEDFEKVTLKTKGGHASIYSAIWKDGLLKWDSEELLFENVGPRCVILKKLENSSQMDGRWLEKQCWDAMPENRPDALEISQEITKFVKNYYESSYTETYKDMESQLAETSRISAYSQENTELKTYLHNSQLYCFKDLPRPKNATDEIKDKSVKINRNGLKGKHFRFKINVIQTLSKIKTKYLKKLKSKNTHDDNL